MRVFLPIWIAALLYAWSGLDTAWIPHDEGTLAQAAERVMQGELPHRDFDEVYTGGLDWVNAAAFRLFGTSLFSMRIPLFVLFALWVPAVWWIARRFASPLVAAVVVLLCVLWSLPTYPAPMPSWYVLFLATFGVAALLKHAENGRRRWLFIAGACGGLAVLAKITGLHFVAAGLFYLAWKEPAVSAQATRDGAAAPGRVYPAALSALVVLLIAALVKQIWPLGVRWTFAGEIEHFVLPQAVVAVLVARRAWTASRAPDRVRFRALLGLVVPFVAGFAIPIAAFLAPFATGDGLRALADGVLFLPARRMSLATTSGTPPPVWTIVHTCVLVAIALIPAPRSRRGRVALLVAGLVALLGLVVADAVTLFAWSEIHLAMRHLVPIAVVLAAVILWKPEGPPLRADRLAILAIAAAFVSLVQFPFSVPIYFFYCAPLVVLLLLAAITFGNRPVADRPGLALLAGFAIVHMIVIPMRIGAPWQLVETARLETPRSRLDMYPGDVREYDQVLSLLESHARGGFVWAGPDAPEIAFLTGLRNPTRTIFDCFDPDFADPPARAARILREIDARGVTAVAILRWPAFSKDLDPGLEAGLLRRFPNLAHVGRYDVAWRD